MALIRYSVMILRVRPCLGHGIVMRFRVRP
ncbi:hypothetical protein F383_37853 [Gossypium arboreum]|uniref:Uncharacterized protein n=1 Tax=Gossypium arboreum TaxID=29729 RepID=A0A0B0MIL3_GOSAR|nr:hypothetical protein F383_37853 [Gossypium arboreum]